MDSCCNGGCTGCSGCSKTLELTQGEIDMLCALGQIPFLPIARKAGDETPIYLEDNKQTKAQYSLILQVLEKKNLISLDYDNPLSGADMSAYAGYPIHGSMALTPRGQAVLEMLNIDGIQ